VRYAALSAACHLASDATLAQCTLPLLSHSDGGVRRVAAEALGLRSIIVLLALQMNQIINCLNDQYKIGFTDDFTTDLKMTL
jgi:hypothetical protein